MKTPLVIAALLLTLCGPVMRAQDPAADPLTREREEQTGTAITILFDNSGSMKEDHKIAQAKSAFRTWLQTIPADYKLSLITFENQGKLAVPLGEKTRDLVAARVAKLEANTGTPICGALRIARQQIETRRREVTPYERHVVLIFTDGQETTDPRGIEGVRADIAALRAQTVEVVGIGFHGQGDYMKDVATRFALAGNEQELKQGLAKVDAEVGGTDDLVISKADLAELKQFNAPALPVGAVAEAAAVGAAETTASPPKRFGMRWILFGIFIWFVVRRFTRAPKQSR